MTTCCVPFCKSNAKKPTKPRISFHEFPCDENLRIQWLRRIARKDFRINDKSNSTKICSIHFTQQDYIPNSTRARLKKEAIPTVFPMYPSYALLPPPNNYLSLESLNHVKKPYIVKDKTKNSTKTLTDVTVKSDCYSPNNTLVKQQDDDRIFTINKENKDTVKTNSCSLVSLNHLKRPSMVETVTENLTKMVPIDNAFNPDMTSANKNSQEQHAANAHVTSANNSLVGLQHKDRVFTLKKAAAAKNNNPPIILIYAKKPSMVQNVAESSTKIVPADITYNYDITFPNNNLVEQQHEDLICMIKNAQKHPPEANSNQSCVSLNHVQRPSTVETVAGNSTKIIPVDIAANSDVTSTNNNVLQTKMADQQKELKRWKSLVQRKNRRLEIVKKEMNKLKKKVSFYENYGHYKILRNALTLKQNCPQSNFIVDQLENILKKRPTWKESTIRECASWVACSPKGYDFVRERKLLVLPCKKTLQRYAGRSEFKTQKMDTCHLDSILVDSNKTCCRKMKFNMPLKKDKFVSI